MSQISRYYWFNQRVFTSLSASLTHVEDQTIIPSVPPTNHGLQVSGLKIRLLMFGYDRTQFSANSDPHLLQLSHSNPVCLSSMGYPDSNEESCINGGFTQSQGMTQGAKCKTAQQSKGVFLVMVGRVEAWRFVGGIFFQTPGFKNQQNQQQLITTMNQLLISQSQFRSMRPHYTGTIPTKPYFYTPSREKVRDPPASKRQASLVTTPFSFKVHVTNTVQESLVTLNPRLFPLGSRAY